MTVVCRNDECPKKLTEMTMIGETETAWVFTCYVCGARRGVSKHVIGGTIGAGRKEPR